MKKLLLIVLCCIGFIGCSNQNSVNAQSVKGDFFEIEKVGESANNGFTYYRDKVTDVLYLWKKSYKYNGFAGGLTMMSDPETGLPLTYTKYMDMHNETQ